MFYDGLRLAVLVGMAVAILLGRGLRPFSGVRSLDVVSLSSVAIILLLATR